MNAVAEIKQSLIPYPVIVMASDGDAEAINAVLTHYKGYIKALATKRLFDEDGNSYLCIDEGLRRRLETKLITAILKFDVE